jgi:hypothetical protein
VPHDITHKQGDAGGEKAPNPPGGPGVPARRGRRKRPAIAAEQVVGGANVRMLQRHLDHLRGASAHGNRVLHYDTLLMALLLGFYNPICRSLRMLEGLGRVSRDTLGVDRLCRSTTSEAMATFDPRLLLPVIDDLRDRLPSLPGDDADLETILREIIAADGTYINACADMAWAIHLTRANGRDAAQVRMNFQIDVRNWVPAAVSVSGKAQGSETAAVAPDLLPGVIYLVDRNFIDFDFFHAVLDKGSDFVVRCKDNMPGFQPRQERPLTERDRADGVTGDRVGILPGRGAPDRALRELVLCDPRTGKSIRVLTSLLDLPAHLIGILYRRRWQVELFFRWLKVWGRFEHLISHTRNGLTIQFYVAVIGVLLMYLATGRRVSKYAFSLLGFVAAGQATLEDILPELERREREKRLERERLARKRAEKLAR